VIDRTWFVREENRSFRITKPQLSHNPTAASAGGYWRQPGGAGVVEHQVLLTLSDRPEMAVTGVESRCYVQPRTNQQPRNALTHKSLPIAAAGRPARTLAQKTVWGFFWLMAQTVGSKAINMAGQVALAWLLSPADFGLVGLAYTVTAFAGLIQQAGLREILIHRHHHFNRWVNPAFWMALTLGGVGALVMVAAAPLAAWMYDEPPLVGLVLVLALAAPVSGLDAVADAKLSSELRFGYLAAVKWVSAVVQMGLSVVFAFGRMGPYAFVLPVPIVAVLRLVLLWLVARPKIRGNPHLRRWKYLLTDSTTLFFASFFVMLTWQGDYMVLGMMHDAKTVGIYFFAFNLSIQTMQVLTNNLAGVLFPALSKLQQDPVYQTRIFLRASQLLAVVGAPLCLLQAALAGPVMALLFNSWWYPAIRVLQLLSLGMAVRLVASAGGSLMQAQGRFGAYLLTNAVNAVVFLSMVAGGSWLGQVVRARGSEAWGEVPAAVTVAGAVMVYFMLIGPIFLYVAIRPGGGRWRDVGRVYIAPLLAGVLAIGAAAVVGRQVPMMDSAAWRQGIRVILITVCSVGLYVPLMWWMAPESWEELRVRLGGLYRGRAGRVAASATR
jgi:PST family polysaccharide transporter